MSEKNKVSTEMPEEPEMYEEPPRMSPKDAIGVIVAIVLLAVIAVAGYIWLTPGKSFSLRKPADGGGQPPAAATAEPGSAQTAGAPAPVAAQSRCAQCGMFANKSLSHVKVAWSDGGTTDHDSWNCVFAYGTDHGLILTGAQTVEYSSALENPTNPRWLDAQDATYLYDTERVEGSMPPYVAALAYPQAALQAQAELGGQLHDFTALAAEWGFSAYDFALAPNQAEPAPDSSTPSTAADGHEEEHGMEQAPPAAEAAEEPSRIDPLEAPQTHTHDMSCPHCGMPADASPSEVVVIWSNGNHEHYDSWDCVFTHAKEAGLDIVRAVVRQHGLKDAEPHWLKAQQAWYLYDTQKIPMSMPPFVAAFETHDAATAAQAELGGEVVNFAELSAHWE